MRAQPNAATHSIHERLEMLLVQKSIIGSKVQEPVPKTSATCQALSIN
ncbi:hypothetical protein [Paraburkholderia sp. RL18-085-BIA-A]